MKRVCQFFFFITPIFILISSCKKDSVTNAKSYAGVYVGDVTQLEGSMNKTTVIKNCTIIITSTDNSGQVTVEADKIFYSKMIGNINGTILTLTPKEANVTTTIISKKYGTATFSGNSLNIDIKQDDNQNGNLYYQTRWTGILKK
jgi:hypothetical protein